jgi:hypothetical protein
VTPFPMHGGATSSARSIPMEDPDAVQVDLRLLWLALVEPPTFWAELAAALAYCEDVDVVDSVGEDQDVSRLAVSRQSR